MQASVKEAGASPLNKDNGGTRLGRFRGSISKIERHGVTQHLLRQCKRCFGKLGVESSNSRIDVEGLLPARLRIPRRGVRTFSVLVHETYTREHLFSEQLQASRVHRDRVRSVLYFYMRLYARL